MKNYTVNGLKSVYSLSFENDNFRRGIVDYDSSSLVNNGIAYSIREKLYSGIPSKNRNCFGSFFYRLIIKLFDAFVGKDLYYNFD